ncbi:hypothetical protein SISNIDRAFT_469607 [Sistotremastrum niveocremeum HHB9708]|uniref:Uncharacterized protein n=1 Tax=Sistotremastrum niveocremeum HHB9708 TaxID=1314777 RepID=A0A164PX49_9AGAM|nr:hypothetical protein SISNIDRAFT_469607 [Sistotremastrum niveocremeum HHB9708]
MSQVDFPPNGILTFEFRRTALNVCLTIVTNARHQNTTGPRIQHIGSTLPSSDEARPYLPNIILFDGNMSERLEVSHVLTYQLSITSRRWLNSMVSSGSQKRKRGKTDRLSKGSRKRDEVNLVIVTQSDRGIYKHGYLRELIQADDEIRCLPESFKADVSVVWNLKYGSRNPESSFRTIFPPGKTRLVLGRLL